MRVALSAGHGGLRCGAISADKLLVEKTLNLSTCQRAMQQLDGIPWVDAHLIRSWDETLRRSDRRARATTARADVVFEVHYDSLPTNPSVYGMRCYHHPLNRITKEVAHRIVESAPTSLRPTGSGVIAAVDRPDRNDDDWLVRPQTVVNCYQQDTILVECCFLSSPRDLRFLLKPRAQDLIANAIVAGVLYYSQVRQRKGV
jgi:N-acetylmuramoyl-L-alanine amidase